MAFDGIAIAAITHELQTLIGGRIDKITQPEQDEIFLTIRAHGSNFRLMLTCNSSFPRLHLTNLAKESPLVAPMFCMVLRKHIGGGRVKSISQPSLERIVQMQIEARNEMGDLTEKTLILEVMGRHSNIILLDGERVLDSAKHVSLGISARPVLPGLPYAPPPSQNKKDPFLLEESTFTAPFDYTGISKSSAGLIGDDFSVFYALMEDIKGGRFYPSVLYNGEKPAGFAFFGEHPHSRSFDSPSQMVEFFYGEKDNQDRIHQKSADMRKLVGNLIARCIKKVGMFEKTEKEIEGRDHLRLMGELITANIYAIKPGAKVASLQNYYEEDAPIIDIPLDPQKSAAENAQAYFKKYNKQKRTADALTVQVAQNAEELAYLEAVLQSIELSEDIHDLAQIRAELAEQGFVKRRPASSKKGSQSAKSKPLLFVTEGYEIFVGKNNHQNDQLLKTAEKDDIWMHTKNIPGSHVIIKTRGGNVPDSVLEAAASLCAYYSKGRGSSMIAVDYCPRKNVKKPSGAKPGMVIYESYNTAFITPDENFVKSLGGQIDG